MENGVSVAATYVGAVMGAGFASGQEYSSSSPFGFWGLAGIVVSSGLFALLGWVRLACKTRRVSTYQGFLQASFGEHWGRLADILVSILLFIGMIAMLSGSGAIFIEYFGMSRWLGISLTSIVIALALWYKGEGVLWINSLLIPIKFLFCLGIGFGAIFLAASGDGEGIMILPHPIIRHWLISAILYVSFNLTLAMVVFASLGQEVQKPGAKLGAVCGGLSLGIFAMVIGAGLLRFPEVMGFEIPMVAVAGKLGDWSAFFYVVVLWLAMVTAAIGNAFSLACRAVGSDKANYHRATILLLVMVFPLAGIKFSRIVEVVYPICGYIGLIFLPVLLYYWGRMVHNT